jgi:hypothetical protein
VPPNQLPRGNQHHHAEILQLNSFFLIESSFHELQLL